MSDRTAKEIIDEAISENRIAGNILYGFAITFVFVGLSVLIFGAVNSDPVSTILGAVSSSLFWPSMTAARRTRKENIAIRLLEAPLSRADTAREASEMLRDLLKNVLGDNKKDG